MDSKFKLDDLIFIPKYRGDGVFDITEENVRSVTFSKGNIVYNGSYDEGVCFLTKHDAYVYMREHLILESLRSHEMWSKIIGDINEKIAESEQSDTPS